MTSKDNGASSALVLAAGTCGKCGHEIEGVPCRNTANDQEKDVRCRECGGVTVLREFKPWPVGGGGADE
jgi:DNA-directed RNA polymerase subunit RPC12/RpoP